MSQLIGVAWYPLAGCMAVGSMQGRAAKRLRSPLLVIVLIVAIIAVPIHTIRDGPREILAFAPEAAIQEDVRRRVGSAIGDLPLANSHVRMMKVGRFLYVLNQLVVSPEFKLGRVSDLDAVHARIADAMQGFEPTPVVDTVFTEDEKWTE